MKKLLALLIAASLLFSLAACGGSGKNDGSKTGADDTVTEPAQNDGETTSADETAAEPTAEESPYFNNGAVLFRAFLELSGEEFVSLVEEQGFAWYEDDYVMSGFGDSGKSSGFQKNYLADYIQVYNSPTDYRSYEDIKSAGKGDLAKMGVAFNVKGEYADGQEALSAVFDGLEIADTRKDPYDEKGSGAALIKDENGTEYFVLYTTEFYTNKTATVSIVVRTDDFLAANPFAGTANSVDAAWSQIYS